LIKGVNNSDFAADEKIKSNSKRKLIRNGMPVA